MNLGRPPVERRTRRRATNAELTARVSDLADEVRVLKQRIARLLHPGRPMRKKR